MRVLIVGEGKSGTTALLRSVADAMGDPEELFEPREMTPEQLTGESLVVKKLLLNWRASENDLVDRFDKRIHILRDPRDRLISHLLYDAYNKGGSLSADQRQTWLNQLRRKAESPGKVTLLHLINAWWRISRSDLTSHYVRALDRSRAFNRRLGDEFHTLFYEDYVDGKFADVDEYLGLPLADGVVKDGELRVARSGSHGEWRRWFTSVDVKLFRPMTHDWLRKLGYDHRDWEFTKPAEPLDLSTTVDYVEALFARCPLPETNEA